MKKILITSVIGLTLASCGGDGGKVKIQLPSDYDESTLVVNHTILDNMFAATSADDVVIYSDTLEVQDGVATLKLDKSGAARYSIIVPEGVISEPEFYASPGDKLEVVIESFKPVVYSVTGSPLMDDLTALTSVTSPIQQEYVELVQRDDSISPAQLKEILDRYDSAIKKFVADHPDSHAIPLAIIDLSGDDFKQIYDNLSPEVKKSILMPFANAFNKDVEEMVKERDAETAQKELFASGTVAAPDFTLPDLSGKQVSLSDFRGKWVVLDFWGSWCGWCIKGFPALKKAYAEYGDKLVIVGIDCNDSDEDWRAAVKKYELPWLQLFNGHSRDLYEAYKIEGFPTKCIINPEGMLVDVTTGEDPSFFTRLASLVR